MNTQVKGSTIRRWAGIFVIAIAMTVFLVPISQAADEVAYRAVYHSVKMDSKEVGDVPGHIQGVGQNAGLGFFTKGPGSGEIATRMATFSFDLVKGKGNTTTDIVYTFRDGSTMSIKSTGTFTSADGGKTSVSEGTYEVTGGTGRFSGIKGKGAYKGERLGSRETGSDGYADMTGTCWKELSRNEAPVMETVETASFGAEDLVPAQGETQVLVMETPAFETEDWVEPKGEVRIVAVKSPSFGTEDWVETMQSSEALGVGTAPAQ